jgi:predicted dehydrogenase
MNASDTNTLPVAVVGCGRMGRLHARAYSQLSGVKLVGLFDADAAAAHAAAREYGGKPFGDLDELANQARSVSIATPTRFHLAAAEPFLRRGVACLIEKPLAPDEAEGAKILALARQHGSAIQVGHIERFNPAVRALAKLNLSPRYLEAVRVSPMTFRSIDVGVVLDVMIHDIDIVLSLARSPVTRLDATGVSVLGGGVEDVCTARLAFENGCVANLTASRLALKTERRLRVFSRDAYVSLDYHKKQGVIVRRGPQLEALRDLARRVRTGHAGDPAQLNYAGMLNLEPLPIDDVEPIRAELEAFIATARDGAPPVVSGADGLSAVRIAQRIIQAIAPDMEL